MLFNENKSKSSDGPPYFVDVNVTSGESLAIQLFDGNKKFVAGPATITMTSNGPYPPVALPVNLPPGHMMQQIVDENGILKHIIISANNTGDQTSKNQILTNQMTKNGAKLIPVNGTTIRPNTLFSAKRKKFQPTDTFNKTTSNLNEAYNSTSFLNSNNLVYPLCCYCCPDCLNLPASNQINSNASTGFSNNELSYIRPATNFYSTTSNNNKTVPSNSYPKRQPLNTSSAILNNKTNNNREIKNEKRENYNDSINQINQKNHSTSINTNSLSSNKNSKITNVGGKSSINNNINSYPPFHNSNNLNLSTNYPVKSALLSTKQICKQCIQQEQQFALSQKYLYTSTSSYNSLPSLPNNNPISKNKYHQPNINQFANTYQTMNKKFIYAVDAKQSNNKNRALPSFSLPSPRTNTTHLINLTPGLLNSTTNNQQQSISNKKDKNDCYSELIRYVNSNHMSAFKSQKRIDATGTTNNSNMHQENGKEHRSNSVTASSSPVSEQYDLSSEESEQTNYKHTTLLNYPPPNYSANQYLTNQNSSNYSNNYQSNFSNHLNNGYNYLNNYSADSSTNSLFISSNNRKNQYQFKPKKINCDNLQVNGKKPTTILKNNKNANESKLNEIESDDQNKILNNERDDGFEGDDYESKSFDNKSNDELIEEQSLIENEPKEVSVNDEENDECCIDKSTENDVRENCEVINEKNKQSVILEDKNLEESIKNYDSKEESDQNNNTIENDEIVKLDNKEPVEKEQDQVTDNDLSLKNSEKFLDENSNEIRSDDEKLTKINSQKVESQSLAEDLNPNEDSSDEESKSSLIMTDENLPRNDFSSEVVAVQNNENELNEIREQNISDQTQMKKKPEQIKIITFSLSYTKLTENCVKLKWTVLNNGNNLYSIAKENQFMVEMIYSKEDKQNEDQNSNKTSRIVYQGLIKHCKIQCLKPLCEYSFRVKCYVDNHLLVSNLLTITTPELQVQPLITKKRTSKHNLQFNIQHQQLLKQQILIEQKQKELELQQQRQQNQFVNKKPDQSLVVILCALCTLFKENFAYLLICFFFISAIFSANYLSDLLN